MTSFYCWFLGEDHELLKLTSAASVKKVNTLALLLIIPVSLWFIAAYLGSQLMFGLSNGIHIIIGFAAAFLVYIMDRAILAMCGKGAILWLRIGLAILSGYLNATFIDAIIFETDFQYIAKIKQMEKAQKAFEADNALLIQALNESKIEQNSSRELLDKMRDQLNTEMNGTGGSNKIGYGQVAKKLNEQIVQEMNRFENVQERRLALELQLNQRSSELVDRLNNQPIGFLIAVEALHELIDNHKKAKKIWIAFTLLFVIMEFLPILVKIGWKKTAYDLLVKRRDEKLQNEINVLQHIQKVRQQRIMSGGAVNANAMQWYEKKHRLN